LECRKGTDRKRFHAGSEQGLAVRCGLANQIGGDLSSSTRAILDDDLLTPRLRETAGDAAYDQVGGATRGIGHNDLHLP
jgi:hypothetical protein